jgi:putative acetyltransferase
MILGNGEHCMVRNYLDADSDSLMKIWLDGNRKTHDFIPFGVFRELSESFRTGYLPKANTLVSVDDKGCPTGFLCLVGGYFIEALFVDEAHRGKGYGSALLEKAKSLAANLETAVYEGNQRAFVFFLNRGFIPEVIQTNEDSGFDETIFSWQKDRPLKTADA